MKSILTIGIMWSLLTTVVVAQEQVIPAIRLEEAIVLTPEQHEENIEICTQNLIKLGKSIEIYLEENGNYPEWLSDLYHPKYLPDPDVLICPADRSGGMALFSANIDPKMPVSYGYQFHPAYQARKTEARLMYGDVVPLIRCRHHAGQDASCLNLSFSYKITQSVSRWEDAPEQLYETPEQAVTALETGLERHPYHERFSYYVYPALARLYIESGQPKKVDGLIKLFRSKMNPNNPRDNFTLGTMLGQMNRNEEALQLFKKLEAQTPNDHNVHQQPVFIKEPEPVMELIGNVVPDFAAIDLDGKPISLEQYRGKVVLLDFWAVWCVPGTAEMPNVKKVYDTYKDEGFDIIGINLDFDEKRLRDYIKENDIPWRQVFSGKIMDNPIVLHYDIRSIPTQWLIDKDGRLISHRARGETLKNMVIEALKE